MTRLFAAWVPLPDEAAQVYDACTPLRAAAPAERWVPAPRLHCTMRFFGEVDDAVVAALPSAVREASALFDPLPLTVRGFGAFPTWTRARVVWAGVQADPHFELLHHEIERRVVALGLEVEGRIFRPHLTLARLSEPARAVAIRNAARGVRMRCRATVRSVSLIASRAAAGGHRYDVVATANLGRT